MSIVQGTLASEERLQWLSEQLAEHGAVTIAEAAASLDVSEMTIRRALAELEERGTARRVRGGARALGPRRFEQRSHTATRAKAKIAAKLARLLPALPPNSKWHVIPVHEETRSEIRNTKYDTNSNGPKRETKNQCPAGVWDI